MEGEDGGLTGTRAGTGEDELEQLYTILYLIFCPCAQSDFPWLPY